MPSLNPAAALERVRAILTPGVLEVLGPRQREAILAGNFLLAMCDGELSEVEFTILTALASGLGLDGDQMEVISGEIDRDEVGTRLAEANLSIGVRNAVIACFVLVAKADGELREKEWSTIYALGAALGRQAREVETIASRVASPK